MSSKNRNGRFGIRAKLMATVTLPMAAIIVAAAGTLAVVETRHARSDAELAAEAIARALNQDLERLYLTQDQHRSADLVDRLATFKDVLRVTAFDDERRTFFDYSAMGAVRRHVPPESPPVDVVRFDHGDGSIALSAPLTTSSRSFGAVFVELSTAAQDRRLARVYAMLGGAAALALLTSIAMGRFIERTVSRPIVELAATMGAVAEAEDFGVRAAVNSTDEVGKLAAAFNTMLDRIQASDDALRAANRDLESKVAERTSALTTTVTSLEREVAEHAKTQTERERLYRELVDASRQAGMAEVANGVLHNVGNVLNSVNVSANLLVGQCQRSRVGGVEKLWRMLDENRDRLSEFLTCDAKGRKTVEYVKALGDALQGERDATFTELKRLTECIEHIKEVVATQQNYGRACSMRETTALTDLVEDALKINAMAMERHQIAIERDFAAAGVVFTERHRVLQILVNLLSNAKYATSAVADRERRIRVTIGERDGWSVIDVIDNGVGIAADAMTKIFSHGFTTRPDGHGFGLHSSALAAKELGGSLHAASKGLDHGATFTLKLPIDDPGSKKNTRHAARSTPPPLVVDAITSQSTSAEAAPMSPVHIGAVPLPAP
jgi:signal transduction histidine kinase